MNARIEVAKQWLSARTQREQLFFVLVGFSLIYLLWNYVFEHSVEIAQKNNNATIVQLESQVDILKQQIAVIKAITTSPQFKQTLEKQKQLTAQSQKNKQELSTLSPAFISSQAIPGLTKDILEQEQGISLISMKNLPEEAWSPAGLETEVEMPKNIHKYGFELEFHSNYFNTIDYLARLEKLPWHLYWDSLEYKVTTYPNANVTAKLYILSN